MRRTFKITVVILLVLIIGGGIVAYNMLTKPHRDVETEQGIQVTAAQLVKEFQTNEPAANKKYLDKAIQVSGTISDVKSNQDGKTTVTLSSNDALTGVFCTLKEPAANLTNGAAVTIKGICSGMLTDVRLREAVVVK